MFNPIKKIRAWNLNRKQVDVIALQNKFGFTDEVLEKQVAINEERHKHDIPDESEFLFEEFVQ